MACEGIVRVENSCEKSRRDSKKLERIEIDYAAIHSAVYNDRAHLGENFLEMHTVLEIADAATRLYQSFSRLD